MTIAVMQPYFFPYLGYYQLVNAVDKFVFFDDVNFINKGWINRNQVLQQNAAMRFTLPLVNASQNRKINEIEIADFNRWRKDFLKTIGYNYKKASFFTFTFDWLNEFLFAKEYTHVGELAADSIQKLATLLELKTTFAYSSQLEYKRGDTIDGQEKILDICRITGAQKYINPRNGIDLYNPKIFLEHQIELRFINMDEFVYQQLTPSVFVPNLSMIDVLMFNGAEKTRQLLNKYTLI